MKKGLFILSKDLDVDVACHLIANHDFEIDIVVWRHKDYLAVKDRYPEISNVYSLPMVWKEKEQTRNSDSFYIEEREYEKLYGLRNLSRYVAYDYFRALPEDCAFDAVELRILAFIEFFVGLKLQEYSFVVGELSRSYCVICSDLCRNFGVPYLQPLNLGVIDGVAFADDEFKIISPKKSTGIVPPAIAKQKARELVENIRERSFYNKSFLVKSSLVRIATLMRKFVTKDSLISLGNEVRAYSVDRKFNCGYVQENPISRVFKRLVLPIVKSWVHSRKFEAELPAGRFFLYPLHVMPETTTSLYSEFEIDFSSEQAYVAEFIAKAIPSGSQLVVKEHPAMMGSRSNSTYLNFKKFFNIHLLSPTFSTFDAIRRSDCVITHCGTIGIEALILGKPVVVIGSPYYINLPGLILLPNIKDFPKISIMLENWERPSDEELLDGLALLFQNVHFGVKNFGSEDLSKSYDDENIALFSQAIVDMV